MRSQDQLSVVAFFEEHRAATPRRIDSKLEWTNKHTHAILGRLKRIGIIKNIGRPAHPEYRLVQRWQVKVKQPKAEKAKPEQLTVSELCRQNW